MFRIPIIVFFVSCYHYLYIMAAQMWVSAAQMWPEYGPKAAQNKPVEISSSRTPYHRPETRPAP